MKSQRIKSFILLAVFGMLLCAPSPADAFIPDIEGYVLVEGTNAPVPNVWVQLRNSGGGPACIPPGLRFTTSQSRYELTDASGYYRFGGWTQGGHLGRVGVMIDTNFDGSNDAEWYPSIDPCDPLGSPGSIFACGRDPFEITVIPPPGMTGTFDTIGGLRQAQCSPSSPWEICISNSAVLPLLRPIYYHPAGGPLPSSTPTRTPTPTATPTPTPVASCVDITAPTAPQNLTLSCAYSGGGATPIFEVTAVWDPVTTDIGCANLPVNRYRLETNTANAFPPFPTGSGYEDSSWIPGSTTVTYQGGNSIYARISSRDNNDNVSTNTVFSPDPLVLNCTSCSGCPGPTPTPTPANFFCPAP